MNSTFPEYNPGFTNDPDSRNNTESTPARGIKRSYSQMEPLTRDALLNIPLDLAGFEISGSRSWQLRDPEEKNVLKNRIKKLRKLDVVYTPEMSGDDLESIIKVNEQIINLRVEAREMKDSTLALLHSHPLKTLSLLDCKDLTPSALVRLLEKCTNLIELRLSHQLVTNETVEAIAKYCPHLQILELNSPEELYESSLVKVASRCVELQEIKFQDDKIFNDAVLSHFVISCDQLTKVSVSNTAVTDRSLKKIASSRLPIETLDVSSCQGISNAGLAVFLKAAKDSLRSLNLAYCEGVNGKIVELLCASRPPLKHLNLNVFSNNNPIDGEDVLRIITALSQPVPHLESLEIVRIHGVNEELLRKIKTICPTLSSIHIYLPYGGDQELPVRFSKEFNGTVTLKV